MPWCPECKWEYVPGIERCADCGSVLVEDDPNRDHEKEGRRAWGQWESTGNGLFAGCLGAILSWVAVYALALASAMWSGDGQGPFLYLQIAVCSTIGFLLGTNSRARFMPSLIGWLLVSTPFLFAAGLGYAHDESPIPLPVANLIWLTMFLPILLGPLSIAAGSFYTRNRRASLALWLIPAGFSLIGIYVASRIIG